MRLREVQYVEYEGQELEWTLEPLTLGQCNLVVGMNASGKTRALNIIGNLARMLAGQKFNLISGRYDALFDLNGKSVRYIVHYDNEVVIAEKLMVDDEVLLTRGKGGIGTIRAMQLKHEDLIPFQTPENELAVVARRDAIQHPYLQPLHDWGKSVRHYYFGTSLGKEQFAVLIPGKTRDLDKAFDDNDPNRVVLTFRVACRKFGEDVFTQAVLNDLKRLHYPADAYLNRGTCFSPI